MGNRYVFGLWMVQDGKREGLSPSKGGRMLVLSRKLGEVIKIGDDIAIEVVEIRGGRVRLGITAPDEVPVHRQEVWVEIQKLQPKQGDQQAEPVSAPAKK